MNPFGKYFAIKAFYRKFSIPSADASYFEQTGIITPGGSIAGRSYVYHFPGYNEDIFGISLELYLGGWSK